MSIVGQASARQQFVQEDDAHLLKSRGVVELRGARVAAALQPLITNSLEDGDKKSVLAYMLDHAGNVFADLFVVRCRTSDPHAVDDDSSSSEPAAGYLVDCARSLLPKIVELLQPSCEKFDVVATDVSDDWRVFGLLPHQSVFEGAGPYMRYADPRWQMGSRVLRPADGIESSLWTHEHRWQAHAFKVGVLPSTELLREIPVSPLEANLHMFGLLHPDCVDDELAHAAKSSKDVVSRRILPMRIEPGAASFPTMTGMAVTAGNSDIGTVIGHHGVWALVLTNLAAWRSALQAGRALRCADQTVLITWPTWLAVDSNGRSGPAGKIRR